MRVFLLTFLLVGCFAGAQEFPVQGPATTDSTTGSSQLRQYEGCVVRSPNGIELQAIAHRVFKLTSDRALDSYVGEQVSIRAHDVNPNDPSSDERGVGVVRTHNQPVTLEVEEIQKISDSCKQQK